ncbi:MAG: ATP-binding protein [Candidatus Omnitrophica bacterium]|nr:ATP-binding protein [Candidatus Omnitrophota bacterium]MCB9747058.1 ATP-binding protein [Candidatus Omnitrophota bacterium]
MIKRFIFNTLQKEIYQPEINILLGPRQVGKTTLLKQLQTYAKESGLTSSFFDLEQPQILAQFNNSETEIIKILKNSGNIVFIDEFQYIQNASKIFKAIYDADKKIKIICSGSSSIEIHKHLKESLAGRKFIFRIYPLSFEEMKKIPCHLSDYLIYGGLPGLTNTKEPKRKRLILDELLSSYILKDIKSLIKEENIRAFNHLLYLLAQNQGSVVSMSNLANQINLSAKAISRYMDILEETYVNFRVHSYSTNLGNELKKSCKNYLYDLGIRNALLKDFSSIKTRPDKGVLYESFVYLALLPYLEPNMEIKFWRTKDGDEVDFILLHNRMPTPIEVKSTVSAPEIPKGITRFLLRYPNTKHAYIINENLTKKVMYKSCEINFITFENIHSVTQNL